MRSAAPAGPGVLRGGPASASHSSPSMPRFPRPCGRSQCTSRWPDQAGRGECRGWPEGFCRGSLIAAVRIRKLILVLLIVARHGGRAGSDRPGKVGELGGIRTHDPMIKSHVLYRLSYELSPRRARLIEGPTAGVNASNGSTVNFLGMASAPSRMKKAGRCPALLPARIGPLRRAAESAGSGPDRSCPGG